MALRLKLVSINNNQNNSSNLINKYVIERKLDNLEGIDEKIIVSNGGAYKVKVKKLVVNMIKLKISDLDKSKLNNFEDGVKNEKVKFIFNTNTLRDNNEIFDIEGNKIVYLFSNDQEIKQILNDLFLKFGKDLSNDEKKLNSVLEEEIDDTHILKEEDMEEINKNIIDELNDPDFIKLLSLSKNRPELFDKLYQFLGNGDIVDKEEFISFNFDNSDFKYNSELETLQKLNLNTDDENIKKILMFFNGHLNLSLRYIMNEKKLN
jgi:hypothetical protein